MKREDLGGFSAEVNLDPVPIVFEFPRNPIKGVLHLEAFCINLLSLDGLTFDTFPKIADHHGLTDSKTWGHRNGGKLKHSGILVGGGLWAGRVKQNQQGR